MGRSQFAGRRQAGRRAANLIQTVCNCPVNRRCDCISGRLDDFCDAMWSPWNGCPPVGLHPPDLTATRIAAVLRR